MQEKSELNILLSVADLFAEHSWQKHEMVVMYPHHVVVLNILGDGLCKQAVCLGVCAPCRFIKGYLPGMVVEKRPQDRVLVFISKGRILSDIDGIILLEKPL